MSVRTVYFNGAFVPESEARVSIFASALMYGDMAFEMTRTFNHKPFRLREHLERLYGSLRLLEIDCGLTIDEMERATLATLKRNIPTESADVDWKIMHDVSRGPLPLYGTSFADGVCPTVSINCWPLISHMGGFAATMSSTSAATARAERSRRSSACCTKPAARCSNSRQTPTFGTASRATIARNAKQADGHFALLALICSVSSAARFSAAASCSGVSWAVALAS